MTIPETIADVAQRRGVLSFAAGLQRKAEPGYLPLLQADVDRVAASCIAAAERWKGPLEAPPFVTIEMLLELERDVFLHAAGAPLEQGGRPFFFSGAFSVNPMRFLDVLEEGVPFIDKQCAVIAAIKRMRPDLPVAAPVLCPLSQATGVFDSNELPILIALALGDEQAMSSAVSLLDCGSVQATYSIQKYLNAGADIIMLLEPGLHSVYMSPSSCGYLDRVQRFCIEPVEALASGITTHDAHLAYHNCGEFTEEAFRMMCAFRPLLFSVGCKVGASGKSTNPWRVTLKTAVEIAAGFTSYAGTPVTVCGAWNSFEWAKGLTPPREAESQVTAEFETTAALGIPWAQAQSCDFKAGLDVAPAVVAAFDAAVECAWSLSSRPAAR